MKKLYVILISSVLIFSCARLSSDVETNKYMMRTMNCICEKSDHPSDCRSKWYTTSWQIGLYGPENLERDMMWLRSLRNNYNSGCDGIDVPAAWLEFKMKRRVAE